MREQPVLYMVIPCYNEQEVLLDSAAKLKEKMESLMAARQISRRSKVCFVNDGSRDKTWEMICDLCIKDGLFSAVNLAHNRGHQNAVTAGLLTVKDYCDAAISMDADLQDDINAIDAMVEKYRAGCNIVYGVRESRKSDSFFKRVTAQGFYRFMQAMGADVIYNHADFRLMDKTALEAFAEFREVNLFLRGVIPMIGLNHDCVYYERKERLAGESKYPWENARPCLAGHYLPDEQSHRLYRQAGTPDFPDFRRCPGLVPGGTLPRHDDCRLDQPDRLPVVPRRPDPIFGRNCRGVYRQDLPGSQASSEVHRPGFH